MNNKATMLICALIMSLSTQAQTEISYLYKGKMDSEMDVTLYMQEYGDPCNGKPVYHGMYKYDGVSKWLALEISTDDEGNFIMTERPYTGTMLLKKKLDQYIGTWLKPDGTKRLKVEWRQQYLSSEEMEEYKKKYEELIYSLDDC